MIWYLIPENPRMTAGRATDLILMGQHEQFEILVISGHQLIAFIDHKARYHSPTFA